MQRKKIKLAGIAVITLVLALTLAYFYAQQSRVIGTPSVNPALLPYKQKLKTVYQNKALNEVEKQVQVKQIINTLPQPYRRQYQLALSSLPDINFYAQFIDQYGQPVANAGVWQNGGSAYLRGGGGRGYASTDEEGYLQIKTTGAFLELGGVIHPEIDWVNYPVAYRMQSNVLMKLYNPTIRFESASSNIAPDKTKLYTRDYDSKENAFIIKAWRQQGYEGAMEGKIKISFNPDGRMYTLKLDRYGKRDYVETFKKEGQLDGDLWVSCTRDAYKDGERGDYGDWHLSITPVNGGIQETEDLYMNMAPETGYQPALVIDMKKGARDYKVKLFNKRYYFKSNNGQQYGLLYVDIMPFPVKDRCNFTIKTFRYNPTGSRNLEMLRDKTSMPELPDQNAPQRIEVASR